MRCADRKKHKLAGKNKKQYAMEAEYSEAGKVGKIGAVSDRFT